MRWNMASCKAQAGFNRTTLPLSHKPGYKKGATKAAPFVFLNPSRFKKFRSKKARFKRSFVLTDRGTICAPERDDR